MYTLNELFKLCRREKITVSELSQKTGIERTRLHRLVHSQNLPNVLYVGELKAILRAFPYAEFDFFN